MTEKTPLSADAIVVEHRPDCPVASPDFRFDPNAPRQCNCDFGRRLVRMFHDGEESAQHDR